MTEIESDKKVLSFHRLRLKHELRDAQDALDVLKKAITILGK